MKDKVRSLPPFAAGVEAFSVRVGVLDPVQSTACGPARRIGGDSVGGVTHDSGCAPKVAPESPPRKDAPACATNESSTVAFQKGEGDLPT